MKQTKHQTEQSPYNKAVQAAYNLILKETKTILSTIEHEELRYTLIREDKHLTINLSIIHEFVSPLLYLRLERSPNNLFVIHYGFEMANGNLELSTHTAYFTRAVYRLTSKEQTTVNIESCVHNDWCITECSALYEYVEEQAKYHQFALIKYKAPATKRKQMKAVA